MRNDLPDCATPARHRNRGSVGSGEKRSVRSRGGGGCQMEGCRKGNKKSTLRTAKPARRRGRRGVARNTSRPYEPRSHAAQLRVHPRNPGVPNGSRALMAVQTLAKWTYTPWAVSGRRNASPPKSSESAAPPGTAAAGAAPHNTTASTHRSGRVRATARSPTTTAQHAAAHGWRPAATQHTARMGGHVTMSRACNACQLRRSAEVSSAGVGGGGGMRQPLVEPRPITGVRRGVYETGWVVGVCF